MADRGASRPAENETRFGTRRSVGRPGILMVDAPSGHASVIAMQDSGGTTRYLWFATDGDLRVHSVLPTDYQSDGTVAGTQS